jgi:hypothetical protein
MFEWFSRKTSVAGVAIPNWLVMLGAIVVLLALYNTLLRQF